MSADETTETLPSGLTYRPIASMAAIRSSATETNRVNSVLASLAISAADELHASTTALLPSIAVCPGSTHRTLAARCSYVSVNLWLEKASAISLLFIARLPAFLSRVRDFDQLSPWSVARRCALIDWLTAARSMVRALPNPRL